jgi:hypothetical protein
VLADTPGTPSPHQQQVDLLLVQQGEWNGRRCIGGDTAAIVINEVATNKRNTRHHPLLATVLMVPKRQDVDCVRSRLLEAEQELLYST